MNMQSADSSFLNRSASRGAERRAPPPVKPKPSGLASVPIDNVATPPTATNNGFLTSTSTSSSTSQRTRPITVTNNGVPASNAFGELRKTFERQQNSSPLFLSGASNTAGSFTRDSAGREPVRGGTGSGRPNYMSHSRAQNGSLNIDSSNNNNRNDSSSENSRRRSISSPTPPPKDNANGNDSTTSRDGIDNSQPDFGNLRARFQSHGFIPNPSQPKPGATRPKPKPPVNSPKPILTGATTPPIRSSHMSLDSINTNTSSSTRSDSPQPSSIPSPYASESQSSSSSPQLPLNPSKQLPRLPSSTIKPNLISKTPTPPETSPSPRVPSPESERNPFMGSDEDESGSSLVRRASAPVRPSVPVRTSSIVKRNSAFQQSRHNSNHGRPVASGRDSLHLGKLAPPAPQRAAPRPESPLGSTLPKLPSRSNSSILSSSSSPLSLADESPEEKERKHRVDKRRRVIRELLETEISFSKDMLLLQEVYMTDMAESHLFTQADEKIIFMNLNEVIELTMDFVALLTPACGGATDEEYNDATTFVGEAFLQMTSRIRRVYSEYCKRQEASAQHLQELDSRKDLKEFIDACTEKCQGRTTTWDLASMLIKPVQRVLKYPLLINQIHALTPPDHVDFESIASLQKEMLHIAEEINDIKKRKDIVEKIVGPKKKNDSDIVHGFNKKFARTTQQLRQAVGGSDVTVDILFEALLEKFNLQQRLARDFAKYILAWLVSIKQYFDTQEAYALTLREIYNMVPIHRNNESHSIILVSEFHRSLSQFSKTIGRELEARLKKTVYKGIENFLKLFAGPLQVMKKREKKLLDYDNVRGMKERGDTIDKNMLESAAAYTAINEQLLDELPKFLGLTTQYFDLIVMEFSKVQMFFYSQVKAKILDFYVARIDPTASRDVAGYVASMNICEDYIAAMTRDDGPLARLERVSLIRNVSSLHEMAFEDMREVALHRTRSRTRSLRARSRNSSSSNASPSPLHTPDYERTSWHSKSSSQSGGGGLMDSPSTGARSLQSPLQPQPRYYPGEDENPFEIPESIFHDGSVISLEDHELFGSGAFGARRLSVSSSSYSVNSGFGGSNGNNAEYEDFINSKPPALDEGMDADEIGIAQALFECTAIYPYSSTEERQLNFEAGESIVVFGLNDNGWYFGKKVGKDATGWFPGSHCIQI